MDELISVIMPVHNIGKYEGLFISAVNSILDQTHKNLELIIVNDKSSDKTADIIAGHLKDDRVKGISLSKNVGPGVARNIGFNTSEGQYVTFQDGDDFSESNRFYELLSNMPEYGMITSSVSINYIHGGPKNRSRIRTYGEPRFDIDVKNCNPKPPMHFSSALMKRDLYRELGGMEPMKFSSDSILAIKLSYFLIATGQTDRIKSLDEVLFKWNRRSDSISAKVKKKREKTAQRDVLRDFLKRVVDQELESEFPINKSAAKEELRIEDNLSDIDVEWEYIERS